MTITNIGKRLAKFMEQENIGVNELGRMAGTSGTQISNIIHGRKYGVDKLLAIIDALPAINPLWLLRGEGEMMQANVGRSADEVDYLNRLLEEKNSTCQVLQDEVDALKKIITLLEEKLAAPALNGKTVG
ncbi:MAG: helix-turn-helix transcriptional regulator [Bacteroidota bacterium]